RLLHGCSQLGHFQGARECRKHPHTLDGFDKICHLDTFLSLSHWLSASALRHEAHTRAISPLCCCSIPRVGVDGTCWPIVRSAFWLQLPPSHSVPGSCQPAP